jgi:ZIP family zinc transporter
MGDDAETRVIDTIDPAKDVDGFTAANVGLLVQNRPCLVACTPSGVVELLEREGVSKLKSFWFGQLSGIVEPIAGVIGAAAVLTWEPILPYALAFAAGAMIFVVIEEVVPEAQQSGNADLATMGSILGFVVMMVLDVALG